jgi:hypothetical protein
MAAVADSATSSAARARPGGWSTARPSAHSATAQASTAAAVAGTARERKYSANGLTAAGSSR